MNTKRIFMPGDEWLYYKIYSGPKFLEELLLNQIYDLTHLLKANAQIDKFFFIRYSDDDGYHLRIRYHFTDAGNICNALGLVTEMMGPFVENRIVWKICIDSYSRELERYGKDAIELVETVFDISSFRVISHLRESAGEQNEDERWLQGVIFVENILNILEFTNEQKRDLYNRFYESYCLEFKPERPTKDYLKNKFREQSSNIARKLSGFVRDKAGPDFCRLKEPVISLANLHRGSSPLDSLGSLLYSIFHMHFNRLFLSRSRACEFVIYYLMGAYYSSVIGKTKSLTSKNPN